MKVHEEWADRHNRLIKPQLQASKQSSKQMIRGSSNNLASDSILRQHITSGTSLAKGGAKSTGTLKTIQSLKDKLSKINNMSSDLSDSQLKELVNLGHII